MNTKYKDSPFRRFPGSANYPADSGQGNRVSTEFTFTNPFGCCNWWIYLPGYTAVGGNGIYKVLIRDKYTTSATGYIYTEGGNGGQAFGFWNTFTGLTSDIIENFIAINRGSVYSLIRIPLMFENGTIRIYYNQTFAPVLSNCILCLCKN